jgi:dihydroorotase
VYSAQVALPLYAQIFEEHDALDQLEGFASLHGPAFYGLPVNQQEITLVRQEWRVPDSIPAGEETVVPLCAGETLSWRCV